MEHGLLAHVKEIGKIFADALDALALKHDIIRERRGHGLMQALVLDCESKPINDALQANGLLANATAGNVLRFLPPYIIGREEVDEAIDILDRAMSLGAQ